MTSYSRQAGPQGETNAIVLNPVTRVEVTTGVGQSSDPNAPGSESSNGNSSHHENHQLSERMNFGTTNNMNTSNGSNDRSNGSNSTPANAQSSNRSFSFFDFMAQSQEARTIMAVISKFLPFVLILIIKEIYDRRVGILVITGLLIAFSYGNSVVKREAGNQSRKCVRNLHFVFFNLLVCILSIYYIFQDQQMHLGLILVPSYSQPLTVSDLFWLVCVTDFVLKMITVMVKGCLVALPASAIAYQERGKWFHFIEITSQAYRSLCPIHPWLYFLIEAYQGVGKMIGVVFCAAYAVCKLIELLKIAKAWLAASEMVLQDLEVGVRPSAEELLKAGEQCPICQDAYTSPILLSQGCGRHIFCEACILNWLDRERTCPLCRAKVPATVSSRRRTQHSRDVERGVGEEENQDEMMPMWRDGSTTHIVQFC